MKPRSGCRQPARGEQGMRAVEVEGGRREVLIGVGTRGGEGISGYIRFRSRRSTLPRACEEKGPTEENSSSLFPRCLRASSGWGILVIPRIRSCPVHFTFGSQ